MLRTISELETTLISLLSPWIRSYQQTCSCRNAQSQLKGYQPTLTKGTTSFLFGRGDCHSFPHRHPCSIHCGWPWRSGKTAMQIVNLLWRFFSNTKPEHQDISRIVLKVRITFKSLFSWTGLLLHIHRAACWTVSSDAWGGHKAAASISSIGGYQL